MIDPKVRIRCGVKGCRHVLAELYSRADYPAAIATIKALPDRAEALKRLKLTEQPPDDWSGSLRLAGRCPRHTGHRRAFTEEVDRRVLRGLAPQPEIVVTIVAWRSLKDAFYRADTLGKTIDEAARPD